MATRPTKRDPRTGELYAVSYYWGWGNDVEVTVLDPQSRVRSSRRVTLGGPVSVHDTAITDKWVVLLDLPVLFDLEMAGAGSVPLPLGRGLPGPGGTLAPGR